MTYRIVLRPQAEVEITKAGDWYEAQRRAPVQRFPYGILYRARDQEIVVVACMHARRDSKRWRDRR